MRKAISLALLLMVAMFCNAQMANPVKFTSQLKTGNTAEGEIIFSGKIEKGWHVYSTNLGSDGPVEASFHVDKKMVSSWSENLHRAVVRFPRWTQCSE